MTSREAWSLRAASFDRSDGLCNVLGSQLSAGRGLVVGVAISAASVFAVTAAMKVIALGVSGF
jgi:hypothetical protein